MSLASSLLVRDHVVSVRHVEEALERQVLYGGDLETNLLELGAAHEEVLAEYRARAIGLPAAGRRELASARPEALRLLGRDEAERYRIVPLRFDGQALVVAAVEQPPSDTLDELGFLLSAEITTQIASEHRLAWALHRYYGVSMPARLRRLLDRLAAEDDEARALETGEAPGVFQTPSVQVSPPRTARASEPRIELPLEAPRIVIESASRERAAATQRFFVGAPRHLAGERPAAGPPLDVATSLADAGIPHDWLVEAGAGAGAVSRPPRATLMPAGARLGPERRTPTPPQPAAQVAVAAMQAQAAAAVVEAHPPRPARVVTVPAWIIERLDAAPSRDDVIEALLEAGRHLFGYVALFVVHEGVVDGKRALGPGASTEVVRELHFPLSEPSAFQTAAESGAVYLGPVPPRPVDQERVRALGRGEPRVLCILPVRLGGRTILLLYTDSGPQPMAENAPAEMAALLPRASAVLERIIRARKGETRAPTPRHTLVEVVTEPPAPRRTPPPMLMPAVLVEPPVSIGNPASDFEELILDEEENAVVGASAPRGFDAPASSEFNAPAPRGFDRDTLSDSNPSLRGEIDRLLQRYVRGELRDASAAADPSLSPWQTGGRTEVLEVRSDVARLVAALSSDSEAVAASAASDLEALGDVALPGLVAVFPGPLRFDRQTARGPLPRAVECGHVVALVASAGRRAIPFVLPLFDSSNAEARFYTVLLAREIEARELLGPLAARVFDDDFGVRMLAQDTLLLHAHLPEKEDVLRGLREIAAKSTADLDRRVRAVEVLGALHDVGALRVLVACLEAADTDERLTQASRRALVALTGQDFGAAPRKWAAWVEANWDRHRIEWLIDALIHPTPEIRLAVGEELKRLTKVYFGYYYNLPQPERERARKRYVDWWQKAGRAQLAGRVDRQSRPG